MDFFFKSQNRSFYNDPAQRNLAMDVKDLKLNRPCIAPYKGLWHRAIIVSLDQLIKYRVKVSYLSKNGIVSSYDECKSSVCF